MNYYKLGAIVVAVGIAAVFSGCTTEKITAEYVMPAGKIDNVKAIDILALDVKADVKGSLATVGDVGRVAGMVKQLLSARLYKEGYISTVDNVWGTPLGSKAVQDYMEGKRAQHGYASLATLDQNPEKGTLQLTLVLKADAEKVTQTQTYTLKALPFKLERKSGVPFSMPDPLHVSSRKESRNVDVYETTVSGTVNAVLMDKLGKQLYSAEYAVSLPKGVVSSRACASVLEAVSLTVAPAIDRILADISPRKETRELVANQNGDRKVVLLLEAKAFQETIDAVNTLKDKTSADYENQGVAYEAIGDFNSAKASYKEALKLNADAQGALDSIKRIDEVKAAAKKVIKSGAKKDSSTSFKK